MAAAAAAEEQTLVFYKILMLCFLCYSGWQAATGGVSGAQTAHKVRPGEEGCDH